MFYTTKIWVETENKRVIFFFIKTETHTKVNLNIFIHMLYIIWELAVYFTVSANGRQMNCC